MIAGGLIAGSASAQAPAPTADPPAAAAPAPGAQTADAPTAAAQPADPTAVAIGDQMDFSSLGEPTPPVPPRTQSAGAVPAPIGSRNEKPDGSVAITAGQRLPTAWDAKVGVDMAAPATLPDAAPGQAQDHGAGWANVAVPAAPIGLDQATVDARVDPAADQGKLSTSLSRSVPVGDGLSITLQNGYAVTQTLVAPSGAPAAPRVLSGDGAVRLDLPTATAVSAGASLSSTDERVLPKVSAEQKLFGSPLSLTGTISERPTGDTDKSITAGFKRNW
ncbi:MAG TPA: hypothetical protein VLX44_16680 [Xanthobacteraceae bacterium]|nr:hypothetical protein [Xanthobacteraceae bacterium]